MEWNKNLEPETEGWYIGSFHLRNGKDETDGKRNTDAYAVCGNSGF